jgi:hypothetical protein
MSLSQGRVHVEQSLGVAALLALEVSVTTRGISMHHTLADSLDDESIRKAGVGRAQGRQLLDSYKVRACQGRSRIGSITPNKCPPFSSWLQVPA